MQLLSGLKPVLEASYGYTKFSSMRIALATICPLANILRVCVCCVGKTYCEAYSESLLTVLGEYLEHEDQEVL